MVLETCQSLIIIVDYTCNYLKLKTCNCKVTLGINQCNTWHRTDMVKFVLKTRLSHSDSSSLIVNTVAYFINFDFTGQSKLLIDCKYDKNIFLFIWILKKELAEIVAVYSLTIWKNVTGCNISLRKTCHTGICNTGTKFCGGM